MVGDRDIRPVFAGIRRHDFLRHADVAVDVLAGGGLRLFFPVAHLRSACPRRAGDGGVASRDARSRVGTAA